MEALKTTVTKRGQTVIPAALRDQYSIEAGTTLAWIDTGDRIQVIPLPRDPVAALRACAVGEGLVEALLEIRKDERQRHENVKP
jgi:AbrB family looped-hinge helix DNA binding protein